MFFTNRFILMKKLVYLFCYVLFLSCTTENEEEFVTVREPEAIQTATNFTLTVNSGLGGTVSASSGTYESGAQVTITATPNIGFSFVGWSGTVSGFNNSITIVISENTTIIATFEPIIYLDDNGVSIKAKPEAVVGLTEFDGKTYEIVSETKLREMVNNGEDLSRVITSKVNNMDDLFYRKEVVGDISHWDVSNVLYMRQMFLNSSFNGDISNWDVSSLLYADNMFAGSEFNSDISAWNTSNLIIAGAMFYNSSFNQDISSWDVSSVTNMRLMLARTPFNHSLNNWDVSSVIDMSNMFTGYADDIFGVPYSGFNQDISDWDVSNVENMSGMFFDNPDFNQDISAWNVSNVKRMDYMFWKNFSFDQNIGNWDVSNVNDMSYMFSGSKFNQDISAWDVSNVTKMNKMFADVCCDQETGERYTTKFNQDISSWDVSNVTEMDGMFNPNIIFNQDLSAWDVSNVIECQSFNACPNTIWTLPKPNFTKCLGPSCN